MQIKEVEKLKSWLFKKLEPLCDADPAALAKYVVALLKKEKPKSALKDLCIDQLEVFLSKETTSFVEKLFRCLESESYLKGEDPPAKTPPPSPPVGTKPSSTPTQKEDKEVDDDDRDFRRSRRNDSESVGGYNSRKVVMTSTASGGGIGRKRKIEALQDGSGSTSSGSGIKRRAGIDLKRGSADSHLDASNASLSDGVSSSTSVVSSAGAGGGSRRPVRERLGPKPEERSDSGRGRRHRRGRSSHSSSSDSSSDSRSGNEGERVNRKRSGRDSGGKHMEGKKRRRCKDYDEKGFCILGENCRYDHGTDPLVIGGDLNPYNPPVPRPLGMPPPGIPIPPMSKSYNPTDAYNPEDPGLSLSNPSKGFIPPPLIPTLPLRGPFPPPLPHMPGVGIPPPPSLPLPHLFNTSSTTVTPSLSYPPHHPRPRPPLPSGHIHVHVPSRPSDTLIIRKVPRDLNTITKLSSHFEKFGTIVNLTVHYEGDPEGALVQFSNHHEAKKAHNSTEAVLNNRFIKIYYLRKDFAPPQRPLIEHSLESPASLAISTIHGGPSPSSVSSSVISLPLHPTPDSSGSINITPESQPAITATTTSATIAPSSGTVERLEKNIEQTARSPTSPLLTNIRPKHSSHPPPSHPRPSHPPPSHPQTNPQQKRRSAEVAKKNLELQKKSHELLKKQIQQQKLLISKLEMSGKHLSAEEKKQIMESLKTLSGSISKLKEAATRATVASQQEAKKERKQSQSTPSTQHPPTSLKEKADALRKQAHILGLIPSPSQPLPSQGQDKSGESDLRSKLDVKPRQLIVINVENRDLLTSYFESFGGLEMVELDPSNAKNLIFTFRNSSTANQVVKKGSTLNGKTLIMKWYTPKPVQSQVSHILPTLTTPATKPGTLLPCDTADSSVHQMKQPVEKQLSNDEGAVPTTPTLMKPDPSDLHLVDDSDDDDEENEGRSWRR